MKWKPVLTGYFQFSRRDRIAVIGLAVIILVLFFLPGWVSRRHTHREQWADTSWALSLPQTDNMETENKSAFRYNRGNGQWNDSRKSHHYKNKPANIRPFYFDPNFLDAEGWKKWGLRDKTIRTILHYREKGGRFREPGDLRKIYGLFPDEYERLAPWIRIEPLATPETTFRTGYTVNNSATYTGNKKNIRVIPVIDINEADSVAFTDLPGIGPVLSARILRFREKLGGFYAVQQVAETYGLPDSTFQLIRAYLKLEQVSLRKININTATSDELKAHPYIRWNLARPILAYRNEHGPFTRVEDLRKVMAVTEEIYVKIVPYLTVN